MRIAYLNEDIKSDVQRGIYQYMKSVLYAAKQTGHENQLIIDRTQKDFQLADAIEELAHPLRRHFRSVESIPNYFIGNLFGYSTSAIRNLEGQPLPEKLDYLSQVGEFICSPGIYDIIRTANNKRFLGAVDLDRLHADTDLFFTAAPMAVRSEHHPIVQTVHDLIVLNIEGYEKNVPKFRKRLEAALEYGTRIIAVSQYTKQEIMDRYPQYESKISVVYQPVPAPDEIIEISTDAEIQRHTLNKFGLEDKNFLFFVGSIESRKNIEKIIGAYLMMPQKNKPTLVFAGGLNTGYVNSSNIARFFSTINTSVDGIKYIGKVAELDKFCLLRCATGFIFPTLTEGFGIPIIEAQSCLCPVISSNVGAIPEVAADSAILISAPHSTQEICDAMVALCSDSKLRRQLAERGARNVKRFSKENFRAALADTLARVS